MLNDYYKGALTLGTALAGVAMVAYASYSEGHRQGEKKMAARNYMDILEIITESRTNRETKTKLDLPKMKNVLDDPLVYKYRDDAMNMMAQLKGHIVANGHITVSEYLLLAGMTPIFSGHDVGWSDLREARVKEDEAGYTLVLPEPTETFPVEKPSSQE